MKSQGSRYIISVPQTNHNLEWMRFGNSIHSKIFEKNSEVRIDFGSSSFISPIQFVVLACSIELIVQKYGCKINFVGGSNLLNKHLRNTKFKNYWKSNFDRDKFTESHNSTTLCLWHISRGMIDHYGQQAQRYFRNSIPGNKDLQPLSLSLVEAFNNIFDHAKSSIHGYVTTQFFPNLNKLSFAVCDFGRGIPQTINSFLENNGIPPLSENLAIEKALERGMTVGSIPQNAGLGLANIKDIVEVCNGKLTIFSGRAYYIKKSGVNKNSGIIPYPFIGTLMLVELDTLFLDEFEEDNEVYEF